MNKIWKQLYGLKTSSRSTGESRSAKGSGKGFDALKTKLAKHGLELSTCCSMYMIYNKDKQNVGDDLYTLAEVKYWIKTYLPIYLDEQNKI